MPDARVERADIQLVKDRIEHFIHNSAIAVDHDNRMFLVKFSDHFFQSCISWLFNRSWPWCILLPPQVGTGACNFSSQPSRLVRTMKKDDN